MSESRVRENLMHGLMRGKRAKPSNLLYEFLSNKKHFVQDAHLAEMKLVVNDTARARKSPASGLFVLSYQ